MDVELAIPFAAVLGILALAVLMEADRRKVIRTCIRMLENGKEAKQGEATKTVRERTEAIWLSARSGSTREEQLRNIEWHVLRAMEDGIKSSTAGELYRAAVEKAIEEGGGGFSTVPPDQKVSSEKGGGK